MHLVSQNKRRQAVIQAVIHMAPPQKLNDGTQQIRSLELRQQRTAAFKMT